MKLVRFKKEYSDSEPRLSYELVSDEIVYDWNWIKGDNTPHYNTKFFGLIPTYKMEEADESEVLAIDVFINLSNIK